MKRVLAGVGRVAATLSMVVLAGVVGWRLWGYYMDAPWTRDGRVRADVVAVAPDVSGMVTDVLVHDNEVVRRGQPLFRIDTARFTLALRTAEAALATRVAARDLADHEDRRFHALSSLSVSAEKQEQTRAELQQAQALVQQAQADLDTARLNLERAQVVAPVDGTLTNFDLQPGNYVNAGKPVTALVDAGSIHVEGYFEETKLAHIHVGDAVTVRLLGETVPLHGHVESIAGAIEDREREASGAMLANINPTFSWVRLAQRIPVRVVLDAVPPGVSVLPGRTATVWVGETKRAG